MSNRLPHPVGDICAVQVKVVSHKTASVLGDEASHLAFDLAAESPRVPHIDKDSNQSQGLRTRRKFNEIDRWNAKEKNTTTVTRPKSCPS